MNLLLFFYIILQSKNYTNDNQTLGSPLLNGVNILLHAFFFFISYIYFLFLFYVLFFAVIIFASFCYCKPEYGWKLDPPDIIVQHLF